MRGVAHEAPRRVGAIGVVVVMMFAVITMNHQRVVAQNDSSADLVGRVALGDAHTCAIHEAETVWCWGSNSDGQLGLGSVNGTFSSPQLVPVFGGNAKPVSVAAGKSHTCALLDDGTLWCWGKNGFGAVSGDGVIVPTPRKVVFSAQQPDLRVTKIFAGGDNTCAMMTDTSVMCWGMNSSGQLGSGTVDYNAHATPERVLLTNTTLNAVSLSIGSSHICARASNNRIWCWGANNVGQASHLATDMFSTPVEKENNGAFGVGIAVGAEHSCALQRFTGQNNAATCFGLHSSSQAPATMLLDSPIEAVYAGGNFSCARLYEGAPQCWGSNSDSQLGSGTSSTASRGPAEDVVGLDDTVVDMSLGRVHACAVVSDGGLKCWGSNDSGQLGNQDSSDHHTAVAVPFINVKPRIPEVPDVENIVETPQQDVAGHNVDRVPDVSDRPVNQVTTAVNLDPIAKPRVARLNLKRGRSVSSKRVSQEVSIPIPKKSQGKMRISITKGANNCRFVGTSIRAVRKGSCTVAVTLLPRNGKKFMRNMVISVR